MKALVVGGGGSLGRAIVRRLLARGDRVRTFGRSACPDLVEAGVEVRRGDVSMGDELRDAVDGCDVVLHAAARVGVSGTRADFERTNVLGTRRVIEACLARGVARLVYTSTPSVVSAGGSCEGLDESAPYATHFEAEYPRSKARAEQLVLAANGPALRTVALRPHLVWGPGDTQLVPRIVSQARSGRLRLVGDGQAVVDTVYIDNAAEAHLLAADRLAEPGAACAGRPYFITQGEPVAVGVMINAILAAAGLPPVTRSLSPKFAHAAGWVLETGYRLLRIPSEPPMTRFLARQLSTPHWFNITAARRDLGYEPRVSTSEGLALLKVALSRA